MAVSATLGLLTELDFLPLWIPRLLRLNPRACRDIWWTLADILYHRNRNTNLFTLLSWELSYYLSCIVGSFKKVKLGEGSYSD